MGMVTVVVRRKQWLFNPLCLSRVEDTDQQIETGIYRKGVTVMFMYRLDAQYNTQYKMFVPINHQEHNIAYIYTFIVGFIGTFRQYSNTTYKRKAYICRNIHLDIKY